MSDDQNKVKDLLGKLSGDPEKRLALITDYLGYIMGSNPINPDSPWKMLMHEQFEAGDQAVVAMIATEELNEETTIGEVRKLHEQVTSLKEELGASFIVPLAAFIGEKRIILYRIGAGNRDERLDLTCSSVTQVSLYAEMFNQRLIKDNLKLEEDEFGFGYDVIGLDDLFTRELGSRFQHTIQLYRKKISEAITGSSVRNGLAQLLTEDAQQNLERNRLVKLVEDPSFTSALGCVVDTIILRQLLRRFLEGYYGSDSFDMSGISLGIGAGTLESALQEVVQVYRPEYEDQELQKAIRKQQLVTDQLSMFDLFQDEELQVTADITFKKDGKERIIELYNRVRRQFEIAYGGDLFAGSVGESADQVEQSLTEQFPELMAKLWADTSTDQYSFRYEDLPPDVLQEQYEASMSHTVQIKIEDNQPVVFYGDDKQEQKEKGAYYTDTKLVDYMVMQALQPVFEERINRVRKALEKNSEHEIVDALNDLMSLKVVDMTCGGGSFLRGAFHWLTDRHQALSRLGVDEDLFEQYPMLQQGDEGRHAWEKHLLINTLYGIDIDYKALIICSQTLTLSALRHWQVGDEFPNLIGRTLIHQNALISPVPLKKREEIYKPYQKSIKKLIQLRKSASVNSNEQVREVEDIRRKLQLDFKAMAYELLGESAEMLHVESLEINIPEVFFHDDGTWNRDGGFDVGLGNPPWEIWKPNGEEFFEKYDPSYRQANRQQKTKIEQNLFSVYAVLEERWEAMRKQYAAGSAYFLNPSFYSYQRWKVNGRFTGSDINLYKISLERFYQVLKKDGYLSILIPGNIASDRGSTGLRHLLLKDSTMQEMLSFENRKKIFALVDSRFKIALVTLEKKLPEHNHSFKAFFYRHDLDDMWNDEVKLLYTLDWVVQGSPDTLSLLELRTFIELEIVRKMLGVGTLIRDRKDLDIWITNELHMKNNSDLFDYSFNSDMKVYKGEAVNQYHLGGIMCTVSRAEILKLSKTSYSEYRVGLRRIARGTDRRTLIATIIPKNTITVDSLSVIHPLESTWRGKKLTIKQQLFILAIMNSFAFDFILRRKVASTINSFYLYQMPFPVQAIETEVLGKLSNYAAHLVCITPEYDELARSVGMTSYKEGITDVGLRQKLKNQIDAYVADLYGLTRDELIYILSTFESPNHKVEMRKIGQGVIEEFDELRKTGELSWPI